MLQKYRVWHYIGAVLNFFCCFQYDEAEKRRDMAKNSLERYTHYYERWATNQSVCLSFPDHTLFLLHGHYFSNLYFSPRLPSFADCFLFMETSTK